MTSGVPVVGVIGAGAWGTSLAMLANRAGSDVTIWTRNYQVIESISKNRENAQYLPDQFIDPSIKVTNHSEFIADCDVLIVTIPAQSLRSVAITLSDAVPSHLPLVLATKGIERGSLMLMSEVVQSLLPHNPYAVLSGPNFAREAAAGLPTATTLATHHEALAEKIIYAAGIVEGRGLGENARAALITRGVAEITRLAKAKGGHEETLRGLSGMGDIMLSCTSEKSRNFALGVSIGKGQAARSGLTEGVATAESVTELAHKLGVAMPIAGAVHGILSGTLGVEAAMHKLLERPLASES